jgi:SAM-dependent methyltransferase
MLSKKLKNHHLQTTHINIIHPSIHPSIMKQFTTISSLLILFHYGAITTTTTITTTTAFGGGRTRFHPPHRHNTNTILLMAAQRRGANYNMKQAAGFGSTSNTNANNQASSTTTPKPVQDASDIIYSRPSLYDLAFGYRNFEDEVDFLLFAHQKYSATGAAPRTILELAAGPARHAIAALRMDGTPVQAVTALDLNLDMVHYGTQLAQDQLSLELQSAFSYLQGDMRDHKHQQSISANDPSTTTTTTPTLFDSAWILLGSLQHMLTNKDAIACFQTVHASLHAGGTLIIELPHPRETFTMVECTRNGWEVPFEDGSDNVLHIVWGDDDDAFDPIRQVRDFTVEMKVVGGGDGGTTQETGVKEIVPLRQYTAQEIDALATIAGFQVVGMYGALFQDVSVNDDDQAYRLVCVLHKIDSTCTDFSPSQ